MASKVNITGDKEKHSLNRLFSALLNLAEVLITWSLRIKMQKISNLYQWLGSVLLLNMAIWFVSFCLASDNGPLALWTVYSARVSVIYFALSFGIGRIYALFPHATTKYLRESRRHMGLSFALAHSIHLAVLTSYLVDISYFPGWTVIIGGGLGYVFIYLMAMTSNDQAVKLLGLKNWKVLHRTGVYYIAMIFTYVYLFRVLSGEHVWISLFFLSTLLGIFVLRISHFFKSKLLVEKNGQSAT